VGKVLTILEVSQKQAYIFASNKLQDNVKNSDTIAFVLSPEYFEKAVKDTEVKFSEKENLVYSGGGHTVLEFVDMDEAKKFNKFITRKIYEEYPDIALFVKNMEYDEKLNPGENLKELTKALEKKKSLRKAAFHQGSFGVERIDVNTLNPVRIEDKSGKMVSDKDGEIYPENRCKYRLVTKFEELGGNKGDSNFIAVVHIDGNAMGKRVENLYEENKEKGWDEYKKKLRNFSDSIDTDFKAAYKDMLDVVADNIEGEKLTPLKLKEINEKTNFPVRRIITAGDDICFVSEGRIGIECAVRFIEALNAKKNAVDGKNYAACAGVAIVHQKYPFYRAYELAEQLCSNAKKFGANIVKEINGEEGCISAIDWHIEYGEMGDSLDEIRDDYVDADGNNLTLRPYYVSATTIGGKEVGSYIKEIETEVADRRYDDFKARIQNLLAPKKEYARGKIKEMRSVLKKGEVTTQNYIRFNKMDEILVSTQQKAEDYSQTDASEKNPDKNKYKTKGLFDAIELMDTFVALEKGEK
jgi:hypothetical protein